MPKITLDALDLAALLSSRICHDVISPVGAIVNGLEVMEDEKDAGMRDFALDLIAKSSKQASARLQFARLAFGAAGSRGAELDLGDVEKVASGLFLDDKITFSWQSPRIMVPKNKAKLLLNLIMLSTNAIPRGGQIAVTVEGEAVDCVFTVNAKGTQARIPANVEELIAGESENGTVDAHGIQPFFAGLVARECGMGVTFTLDGETVTILAKTESPAE